MAGIRSANLNTLRSGYRFWRLPRQSLRSGQSNHPRWGETLAQIGNLLLPSSAAKKAAPTKRGTATG
ncbi:MAG: hypothetical protein ACM32O_05955 [Clostridia bacterium]